MSSLVNFVRLLTFISCLFFQFQIIAGAEIKLTAALLDFDHSPLGALLEAELLQDKQVNWVERTEITKVLNEQKLQSLFTPEAGKERTKLGQLLKADLLILVRSGKKDAIAYLDVTVAEVARGLRLTNRRLPLSKEATADVAELLKVVQAGLAKQRTPIETLYAVPPFLSNDLVYEYDDLRSSYASVLETLLLEQPNALVVELAEADAIAKELALTFTNTNVKRLLPYYLMGRYRNEGKDKDRRVGVQLAIKQGTHELHQANAALPPEEAPEFLRREVATFLKQLTGRVSVAANPKVEAAQLLQSAEEHLKLGSFEEAASLAEASLLLEPQQTDPHVVAIRALTPILATHWGYRECSLDETQVAMACYLRGAQHIVHYCQNGGDFETLGDGGPRYFMDEFFAKSVGLNVPARSLPEVKNFMAEVHARQRVLMLEVVAAMIPSAPRRASFFMARGFVGLSEDQQVDLQCELIFRYQHLPNVRAITRELACYGHSIETLHRPAGKKLLARLAERGNAEVRAEVNSLRTAVDARLATLELEKKRSTQGAEPSEAVPPGAERIVVQPIKLQWIDSQGAARELNSLEGVLATSAGFDLWWSKDALYLLPEKGKVERLFSTDRLNCRFSRPYDHNGHSGLCFDGKYIWAAFYEHKADTRLLVIDPTTKKVSELTTAQGLPDPNSGNAGPMRFTNTISLAPLSPGKVLVAGGFGRGWLAIADFAPETGGKIRVFHEAKETPDGANREQWHNTAISFQPGDIFEIDAPQGTSGNAKSLLIGRNIAQGTQIGVISHPLMVDMNSLAVEACSETFWAQTPKLDRSPANHSIYFVHSLPPKHDTIALLRMGSPGPKVETIMQLPQEGYVLSVEDRVHVVGKQWWIADLRTKKATPAGPVPWYYSNRLSASGPNHLPNNTLERPGLEVLSQSNHYGIIAYYRDTISKNNVIAQITFTK